MRIRMLLIAIVGMVGSLAGAESAAVCDPVGSLRFICDVISPEDIQVVPDTDWVVVSGNQEGGAIQLVSVSAKTARPLFPAATRRERPDRRTYPTCPGPIDLSDRAQFRAHGLYLKTGLDGVHTLHVVHHGSRESVEIFELDVAGAAPSLTWVGCAVALDEHVFNSVVALPEGGFAVTNTRGGNVWEWHTDTGWSLVPGSEDTAPNGLEISEDGEWLYVAGWSEEKITRLSRGRTPVEKEVVQIGFRPDNLRMQADGSMLAAGHTDFLLPTEGFNVARVDPDTLDFTRIFHHAFIEGFAAATTAMQIGDEIWLGTNRGEMIAYFPAP
jgi:hypothetical protein